MKRRDFVTLSSLSAFQLFVQACCARKPQLNTNTQPRFKGLGPLESTPHGTLDLPKDLSCIVLQEAGDAMSDGHHMADQPDGMACFAQEDGSWVLLRNHELGDAAYLKKRGYRKTHFKGGKVPSPAYDDQSFGGVSRLVIDPDRLSSEITSGARKQSRSLISSNYTLVGTTRNCAGGPFQGAWVSCEESSDNRHGYAFLTQATDDTIVEPRRITSWGRFHREAITHDPGSGIVYMTEDRDEACFYRFIPADRNEPMGAGRLQALVIDGVHNSNPYRKAGYNAQGVWQQDSKPKWPNGTEWPYRWIDIPDPQAVKTSCRAQGAQLGATLFHRGEGIAWDGQSVWFSASTAGAAGGGQIYRVTPKGDRGTICLELEIEDRAILSSPDNLVMAPYGDLIMAEDNYIRSPGVAYQYLRGMTPAGHIYDIARNPENQIASTAPGAEFAGTCFSPDGRFIFVNLQWPRHLTIAITAPRR